MHGSITTQSTTINAKISANGSTTSSVIITKAVPGSICYGMVQYNTKNANIVIAKLNVSNVSNDATTLYYSLKNISSGEINAAVDVTLLYLKAIYYA